jgi:hypothetical protein
MLRRLSSFLGDTSLSAQRADTAAEALHLVAEHGRELTDARHSCASWRGAGQQLSARASDSTATLEDERILEHLEKVAHELPVRVSRADWTREPALRPLEPGSNVLTAPITTLDGVNVCFNSSTSGKGTSATSTKRSPCTSRT